jgi:AmmeMemoRadiSam system protein B
MIKEEDVRKPFYAGQFYPEDPRELSFMLDTFFSKAKTEEKSLV